MEETLVGTATELNEFPAEVTVNGQWYFLLKDGDSYKLALRICPHAGGHVENMGGRLICPLHMWSFKETDGACINVPGTGLLSHPVTLKDGGFYADMGKRA